MLMWTVPPVIVFGPMAECAHLPTNISGVKTKLQSSLRPRTGRRLWQKRLMFATCQVEGREEMQAGNTRRICGAVGFCVEESPVTNDIPTEA